MMAIRRFGPAPRTGVARALSKLGVCSRREAETYVRAGRVTVNQRTIRDPEYPVSLQRDRLTLDGQPLARAPRCYVMLNKPRGLVTTVHDERGRPTVLECLTGAGLPRLFPVGRLDQASEGLLLLTNDTHWANGITSPETHLRKTYHVQVNRIPQTEELAKMLKGCDVDGDWLRVASVEIVRQGERNAWLEMILTEGKNRHLRRLLGALQFDVLRLIRTQIGPLPLGTLAKGSYRPLTPGEVQALSVRK